MKFKELNLPAELMRGIEQVGFTDLTPVQEESIPLALNGSDVAAQAQTGLNSLEINFCLSTSGDPMQ